MTIKMDEGFSKTVGGKSLRPVRNRRYSRKSFAVGQRPVKRLFTPEIKRFLKEWLIRRRDNPYPNREEKKLLAVETGLTYIQICNWFANWRRKLKNAGSERHRRTWGHLIKTYNNHAQGNVEQFSICSDDSIWGEPDPIVPDTYRETDIPDVSEDLCYSKRSGRSQSPSEPQKLSAFSRLEITQTDNQYNAQCYHVSSTTEEFKSDPTFGASNSGNKYKSHIMEKYLKGLQMNSETSADLCTENKPEGTTSPPVLLTKWLESAAKFQPCQSNYVTWNAGTRNRNDKRRKTLPKPANRDLASKNTAIPSLPACRSNDLNQYSLASPDRLGSGECRQSAPALYDSCIHGREEVEAAVALTRLASLYRS